MTPSRSYEFGSFRLDADGRVLFRGGQRVALTPKAIDVLIALVEARGQPVKKDELLRTVWAGTVVEEGSLTTHVSLLRKALADGGGDGFIETLSKRGYRFAGPVADAAQTARRAPLRTLTFLFAATEAGTGPGAPAQLHEALQRDAVGRHGGQALRVVEDSFCVAFADAGAAAEAAIDVQRELCAPPGGGAAIEARIGLHSGAIEDADDGHFSGPAWARAARVMAAAHGGQILLSAATVALLDRAAPPSGELRDLGDHTLRGFARPERLYQLTAAGLCSEFPPIRTQESTRTNLPPALTAFIGRQQALAEVREKVQRSRMVTLVGAGGTGKTRLSVEAARQLGSAFPDGVWLVELAPLADATFVPRAIAAALSARAEGDAPPMTLIESTLRDQRVLLLLDNCEHVIDAAAQVAQALLRALPRLHLLATGREPLGIEGEMSYRVPSLTMPGSHQSPAPPDVIASEAGQLFVERAIAVQSSFTLTDRNAAAVAQVCRRLDGIPLAIELAAARLTALSVEEIARRIDDRFRLLTGGLRTSLPRQRTLRALVDWSYDLLSAGEQTVLDTLSVFAGSFSLEAAEQVCAGDAGDGTSVLDAIAHLAAKSLLIAETHDGAQTRYRLLETIRQYAGEKLIERGRADAVRRRHFDCFRSLAETGAGALKGPLALEWLDRLDAEQDNIRAALDGAAGGEDYARLAGAMRYFWDTRGQFSEGWVRLGRALEVHERRDLVRLEALIGAGLAAHRLAYAQRSDDLLGEAIALARELGSAGCEGEATQLLGDVRKHSQGAAAAEPILLRALALAKTAGDQRLETVTLIGLGQAAWDQGQHAKARDLFLQSARLGLEAGCVIDTPTAIHGAGDCALEQLDFAAARRLLDDALVQHRRTGNAHEAAQTLWLLARLALNEDRLDEARALSAESLRVFRALLDPKCGARAARIHATVLSAMGDEAAALQHAESAAETYRELGMPLSLAISLCTVGCIHAKLGQGDAARNALFSGLIAQQRATADTYLPEQLESIAALHPDAPVAAQLLGAAATLREQLNVLLLPYDRAQRERRHADVRMKQPAAEFNLAFAAGRALTRDDAIRSALALR
ncbi:MAG TPA: winged helix-turn-helix domain-containing protein [Burkholderiaceae bacterium]|nr:winged helix-turn-helix domain-containing protein [Burkholderiaceae bacterium]